MHRRGTIPPVLVGSYWLLRDAVDEQQRRQWATPADTAGNVLYLIRPTARPWWLNRAKHWLWALSVSR